METKLYKCDQCGKYREYITYFLHHMDDDEPIRICSPQCLAKYATLAVQDQQEQQKADDEYFCSGSRWPGL